MQPHGQLVAIGGYDAVEVWRIGGASPLWRLPFDDAKEIPFAMASSPDGALLAISSHCSVRCYDFERGELVMGLAPHSKQWTKLRFSPDGQALFAISDVLARFELSDATRTYALSGPSAFGDMDLSPDLSRVIATGDKALWSFDQALARLDRRYTHGRLELRSVACMHDNKSAWITRYGAPPARLSLEHKTRKVLAEADADVRGPCALDPSGRVLVVGDGGGLSCFDAQSGARLERVALGSPAGYVDEVVWSADGSLLLTAHLDQSAKLWRVCWDER